MAMKIFRVIGTIFIGLFFSAQVSADGYIKTGSWTGSGISRDYYAASMLLKALGLGGVKDIKVGSWTGSGVPKPPPKEYQAAMEYFMPQQWAAYAPVEEDNQYNKFFLRNRYQPFVMTKEMQQWFGRYQEKIPVADYKLDDYQKKISEDIASGFQAGSEIIREVYGFGSGNDNIHFGDFKMPY